MVKLYTTHCPQCIMLESMMKRKKIDFEIVRTSMEDLKGLGHSSAPILEVDGKAMNFAEGRAWVLSQK